MHEPTDMDWIRTAILSALIENMTVQDLHEMAAHARTAREFDNAVNVLANTMPLTHSPA